VKVFIAQFNAVLSHTFHPRPSLNPERPSLSLTARDKEFRRHRGYRGSKAREINVGSSSANQTPEFTAPPSAYVNACEPASCQPPLNDASPRHDGQHSSAINRIPRLSNRLPPFQQLNRDFINELSPARRPGASSLPRSLRFPKIFIHSLLGA
jgi:hypothetical protein